MPLKTEVGLRTLGPPGLRLCVDCHIRTSPSLRLPDDTAIAAAATAAIGAATGAMAGVAGPAASAVGRAGAGSGTGTAAGACNVGGRYSSRLGGPAAALASDAAVSVAVAPPSAHDPWLGFFSRGRRAADSGTVCRTNRGRR